jgi:hypothetical protein
MADPIIPESAPAANFFHIGPCSSEPIILFIGSYKPSLRVEYDASLRHDASIPL